MLNQVYFWALWWQLGVGVLAGTDYGVESQLGDAGCRMEPRVWWLMVSDGLCGGNPSRLAYRDKMQLRLTVFYTHHLCLYQLALMNHNNRSSLHYDDRNAFFFIFPWELFLSLISIKTPSWFRRYYSGNFPSFSKLYITGADTGWILPSFFTKFQHIPGWKYLAASFFKLRGLSHIKWNGITWAVLMDLGSYPGVARASFH